MRIQRSHDHQPSNREDIDEHESLRKAVKAAAVITAAAGVYSYFARNGSGFAYIRPVYKNALAIGEDGLGFPEKPIRFDFELAVRKAAGRMDRLFAHFFPPEGELDRIHEAEMEIDENSGITSSEIEQTIIDDLPDSGYQNPLQNG